jgi:hypothetical protein
LRKGSLGGTAKRALKCDEVQFTSFSCEGCINILTLRREQRGERMASSTLLGFDKNEEDEGVYHIKKLKMKQKVTTPLSSGPKNIKMARLKLIY